MTPAELVEAQKYSPMPTALFSLPYQKLALPDIEPWLKVFVQCLYMTERLRKHYD